MLYRTKEVKLCIILELEFFETNSSSADRYDDFDDPTYTAYQQVMIELDYNDDIYENELECELDEKLSKFLDDNIDTLDVLKPLLEQFESGKYQNVYAEESTIHIEIECTYDVEFHDSYMGDSEHSYCDGSDMDINDSDELPEKGQDWPKKEEIKEKILKNLKEAGFTEIKRIVDIYGLEVDSSDISY